MVRDLVRVLVALCATCLALPAAGAQTVAVGVSGCLASEGGCAPPAASVSFQGVRVGGTTVGLALGSDGLGISLQAAEAFGPLGNVVFELDGELRRGPFARARLAARGVVASVAARLAVAAAGDDAERFDPLAVAGDGPLLGGPRLGVEAGGTFRLDRQVILDVAPAVHLAPAGAAVTGGATLRLVRAWGENELQARLAVAALPGGGDHAAVGAALLLPRGRAPDWRVGAWLGYGETGLLPGVTLTLAEGLPGGGRAALTAAYEPYRRDARPLRGTVTLELPLAGPTARLEVAAGALHPRAPDAVAGRLSLAWPFER